MLIFSSKKTHNFADFFHSKNAYFYKYFCITKNVFVIDRNAIFKQENRSILINKKRIFFLIFYINKRTFTYDRRARPTARKQAEKITLLSKKDRVTVKSHLSKRGKYELYHVSVDIIDTESITSMLCKKWVACSWTLSFVCLVI